MDCVARPVLSGHIVTLVRAVHIITGLPNPDHFRVLRSVPSGVCGLVRMDRVPIGERATTGYVFE